MQCVRQCHRLLNAESSGEALTWSFLIRPVEGATLAAWAFQPLPAVVSGEALPVGASWR